MKSMASPELQLTFQRAQKVLHVWAHFGYSRNTTSLKQHLQSRHSDMLSNQLINQFNHGNYW